MRVICVFSVLALLAGGISALPTTAALFELDALFGLSCPTTTKQEEAAVDLFEFGWQGSNGTFEERIWEGKYEQRGVSTNVKVNDDKAMRVSSNGDDTGKDFYLNITHNCKCGLNETTIFHLLPNRGNDTTVTGACIDLSKNSTCNGANPKGLN